MRRKTSDGDGRSKQAAENFYSGNRPQATSLPRPSSLNPEDIERIRTNPPLVMSAPEGATYVGVSERHFRDQARRRVFPSIRVGGRILFRRDALDAALEKLEVKAI